MRLYLLLSLFTWFSINTVFLYNITVFNVIWRCSGKNSPHKINTPPPTNPPPHPRIGSKQRGKLKRLKGRRRHRGHPKGGIQAPGSPQRLTRQHQGGTGYTCPLLMLIEQTHTRLKINYYFQKQNVISCIKLDTNISN